VKLFFERTVDFFSWLIDFFKNLGRRKPDDPPKPPGTTTTYQRKKSLNNGSYIVEGFAVDPTYCYSIEVTTDYRHHRLKRYDNTNLIPHSDVAVGLGHANDATMVIPSNGTRYLYVICYGDTSLPAADQKAIVKLRCDSNGYTQVARYAFPSSYSSYTFAGIAYMGIVGSSGNVAIRQYLIKNADSYYTINIRDDLSGTGTFNANDIDFAFSIDRGTYSGKDYSNYSRQGIYYENDRLYVPLWAWNGTSLNKRNENVVFVYENIGAAITNNTSNKRAARWYNIIKPSTTNEKFEIEGIGFRGSLFWFNTFEDANSGIYTDSQSIK